MRRVLVGWLYGVTVVHLLVAMALPWCTGGRWLAPYYGVIEQHFWGGAAPMAARAQQAWWLGLFGVTVQTVSVFMLALIWQADRHRDARLWAVLIAGLLLWAPQDMLLSASAGVWPNLLVDALVLLALLPPLVLLWRLDRHQAALQ